MKFQYRRLIIYQRVVQYTTLAQPLIRALMRRDGNLASHIERNGNSIGSNLAEGASEDRPKVKANFYRIAKRETEEAAANWEKAVISGHLSQDQIEPLLNLLDEIARMFAGLIKRFNP